MATYAIGDIHGCFDELQLLLDKIAFDISKDVLWFTGDLVNGGKKSIETIQFVKSLGNKAITVLGNHDLTLLGLAMGKICPIKYERKEIEAILTAPNKDELITWMQHLPLIHYDENLNILLVHAGIAPQWDLPKVLALAKEVESTMQGPQATAFFVNMFGNEPALWDDHLTGWDRLRCITNYLTRIRFCNREGRMDLLEKGPLSCAPINMMPWYDVPHRLTNDVKIVFGHWAALIGKTNNNNVISVDTGCVWGNYLSALRLEDHCQFAIKRIKS